MKRLFISEIDTPLGRRVTERFGLTKEYDIIGTLRDVDDNNNSASCGDGDVEAMRSSSASTKTGAAPLPFVKEIVPGYAVNAVEFKQRVLDSDVVICPLTDSTLEAEAAIKMLAHTAFETEKSFVLVSSMMTWANTFAAQRAEELAEKRRERQELIDAGEEVPPEEEELPEPTEEDFPVFTDDQYLKRVPHARYQHWRDLEQITKSANSESLHTNVVFSGLTYGRGEFGRAGSVFHDLFRSAWHAQPLPLFSAGTNVVPLIHIDDLANVVFKIGSSSDVIPQRYILGVDRGNCTLGAVVKAINDSIGCGKTYLVPPSQLTVIPFSERLTVDLRTEPGAAFEVLEDSEWVAPEGFVATIDKIAEEYKTFRGVTPVRSAIIGPPLSGKSKVAAVLAQEYRIQHITVADIITSYQQNLTTMQTELEDARQARRDAKRQAAIEARKAEEAERLAAAAEGGADGGVDGDALRDDADGRGEEGDRDDGSQRGGAGEGGAGTNAEAQADDVSDIDFNEAIPTLEADDSGIPTLAGDDGVPGDADRGDAADGAGSPPDAQDDPEEDEDERIAKLKEEISIAQKVLQLRRKIKYQFGDAKGETGNAEGAEDGEDAAAADDAGQEGGGDAADGAGIAAPPAVENPFMQLRYIDEALATMARWRLGRKDCRNQGYVLDGFPKTVKQAALVFSATGDFALPEVEEMISSEPPAADEGEEGALNPVDEKLFPEHVLVISSSNVQLLVSRAVDEVGKDITVELPSHHSVANTLRRLAEYNSGHTASNRPAKSMVAWMKSIATAVEPPVVPRAASIFEIEAGRLQSDFKESIDMCREFLGSPHFYRPTPAEYRQQAQQEAQRLEAARADALQRQAELERAEQQRKESALQESLKHKRRYETVQREQSEAHVIRSLPMQSYLMEYVVPALTEGIEKTAQRRPADPVDALAEFLFAYTARTTL